MKPLQIISTLVIFTASPIATADKMTAVPLTVEELIRAIDINMTKYEIEFDEVGTISLETKAIGNSQTYELATASKSATLVVYFEKNPNSAGSKASNFDTLHFWISNERGGTGGSIFFKKANAPTTKFGFDGDVFKVTGFAGDDESKNIEFSLQITNN